MLVVLVYRPEALEGPHQSTRQDDFDAFNGVEVYGIYLPAEHAHVVQMIEALRVNHPKWQFLISPEHKLRVGFDVMKHNVPKRAGNF
jgi:hypothetical protein